MILLTPGLISLSSVQSEVGARAAQEPHDPTVTRIFRWTFCRTDCSLGAARNARGLARPAIGRNGAEMIDGECPSCGDRIFVLAKACPGCGVPQQGRAAGMAVARPLAVLLFAIVGAIEGALCWH